MAEILPSPNAPLTEEAFVADREHFLRAFCSFSTWCSGAIVVLLILMALFLV